MSFLLIAESIQNLPHLKKYNNWPKTQIEPVDK